MAMPIEQYIRQGLIARGLPTHVADGFVMNMRDESRLNPGINEQNPTVPGSRGGFGLNQWTGPRRRAYEGFAQSRGVPLDNVDAQLDFTLAELKGPENAAFKAIMAAPDAGSAGSAIVTKFLRPAPEHQSSRVAKYAGMADGPKGQETFGPAPATAPFGTMAPRPADTSIDPGVANYWNNMPGDGEKKDTLGNRLANAGKAFDDAIMPAPRHGQLPGGPSAEQATGLLKATGNIDQLAKMLFQRRMG